MAIERCDNCDQYIDLDYEADGEWDSQFNYTCANCLESIQEEAHLASSNQDAYDDWCSLQMNML